MKSKQNEQFFLNCLYKGFKMSLLFLFFLTSYAASAQTDFLEIPSITLDGQTYDLKWSADVRGTKVIQEYLLPDESVTQYKTKLVVEYILSGESIENIVEAKLIDLANGKEAGRVLNYKKLESENPDEILLEFMIGNMRDTVTQSVEWNVYRYKAVPGGVVLFSMSKRAYEENNVGPFMQEVSENRLNWINSIVNYYIGEK